jgi:hypothetical protein
MTALLRLVNPQAARYFCPGPDDLIDNVFDDTPTPVTVEVYTLSPATHLVGQTLQINGDDRDFTSVSGQNPTSLQFTLGGDPDEAEGGINTVTLSVTDNAGSTTYFALRYFRLIRLMVKETTIHHPCTPRAPTTPAAQARGAARPRSPGSASAQRRAGAGAPSRRRGATKRAGKGPGS